MIHLPAFASVALRTDTLAHLRFAQSMALTGRATAPYFLFEQLTIMLRAAVPFNVLALIFPQLDNREATWEISGLLVLLAFTAWLAVVLQRRLATEVGRLVEPSTDRSGWIAGALTICLLIVAPVTVLTWHRHQLLVGYINVTTYESATAIIARPLSLVLFWVVAERLWSRQPARILMATAALSLLAVHAKPSYSICLLPAVAILLVLNPTLRQKVDPGMWWFGFAIPTVAGLAVQVAVSRGEGGIGIAPFTVVQMLLHSRGLSGWWFLPLVVMSLLFPAAVTLTVPHAIRSTSSLQLAWLALVVGLAMFLAFTVTGRRDYGDLLWGPQIGLFVLFVESVRAVIRSTAERRRRHPNGRLLDQPTFVLAALFALHVVSGVVLWYHEVLTPAAWW